jgi:hypothetical protein
MKSAVSSVTKANTSYYFVNTLAQGFSWFQGDLEKPLEVAPRLLGYG